MRIVYVLLAALTLSVSGLIAGCASVESRRAVKLRGLEECTYLISFAVYVRLLERMQGRLPSNTAEILDLRPNTSHFEYFDPSQSRIEYFVGPEPGSFRVVLYTAEGRRETNQKDQCLPEP
jgi:hypothetical protein